MFPWHGMRAETPPANYSCNRALSDEKQTFGLMELDTRLFGALWMRSGGRGTRENEGGGPASCVTAVYFASANGEILVFIPCVTVCLFRSECGRGFIRAAKRSSLINLKAMPFLLMVYLMYKTKCI